MKKNLVFVISWVVAILLSFPAQAQKKISELMLVYDYSVKSGSGVSGTATNTIYIKGNMSRTEWKSSQFSSTTIYDSKANTAVMMKELSGQKLLIRMNADNIQERDSRYAGLVFTNTADTRVIAGYKCIKATATTRDGFTLTVYYTRDLVPENKDYDAQFKNLDGLPLEYELTNGKITITNILSAINLNPVPASKFDIPKSGYREMTYEESKKLK